MKETKKLKCESWDFMEHLLVRVRRRGSSTQGSDGGQLKKGKLNDGFWEKGRKQTQKIDEQSGEETRGRRNGVLGRRMKGIFGKKK